ncbi:MAG: hypothetical protein KJ808_04580 [Acidobacteria bacterium]|nr:hypothetical protein [Acidobacteriota bacterium]MBU4307635.1 hypothetical protein [Acidobacteriota bacterium]MBU4404393.1 hypothetical protein [Acidobacteriota bacterium]MCG2810439.1 hypothetical protein [Candidatus Aminicenantes bacterium]
MVCKWVRFGYRALPLPVWRAFLLDRHIEHCPQCLGEALGDAAIRSLGVTPADLEGEPSLPPFAAAFSAPSRRRTFRFRWNYAFWFFLAAAILWVAVAISSIVPPGTLPQGTVTVTEENEDACVFAVLEAMVSGEPARPVVFKPRQPGVTIVWFEKTIN